MSDIFPKGIGENPSTEREIALWVRRHEANQKAGSALTDAVKAAEEGSHAARLQEQATREADAGVAIGGSTPSRDVRAEVRGRSGEDTE